MEGFREGWTDTADGSLLSGAPGAPSHTPSPPQAVTSEVPQDVTYAQLNHSTLRRGTAIPPSPLAGEPQQTPVSMWLSLFASPGRTQPQAPEMRSQGPQEAQELPSSGHNLTTSSQYLGS